MHEYHMMMLPPHLYPLGGKLTSPPQRIPSEIFLVKSREALSLNPSGRNAPDGLATLSRAP